MKKTLKITAIIVVVALLIALTAPMLLSGKIETIVKTEASKAMNVTLDFDKLNISLIRHFPNASINLKGLRIVGVEAFEGDTLIQAKEIAVVVDLMSIFSDSGFEVRKVLLDEPQIIAMVNAEGKANWDIMKDQTSTDPEQADLEPSAFNLSLKKMSVKNGSIAYMDDSSKMKFYAKDINMALSGDMSAQMTTLNLEVNSKGVYYVMDKMVMLSNADMSFDSKVLADLKNSKYTLEKSQLTLNAIKVGVDGWLAMVDQAIDMDIKINSDKLEFKELLSLIPAFYTKDFKSLSASGTLSFDAWAKGRIIGDILPAFGVGLKVNNGNIKYADLPKSVDNIEINASVSNSGGTADNTLIDLKKLSFSMAGNPFSASILAANPMSDPDFKASANGTLNLGMIKDVYPLGDSISLSGIVKADISIASRMSYIDKGLYEKIIASGAISIEGMVAKMGGLPDVKISKARASINSKTMVLSEFNCTVGTSDISARGELSNYLAYALKGETLKGGINVNSKLLDMNELMSYQSDESEVTAITDTSAVKAIAVPKNLDLTMTASVAKIRMQEMNITDLYGVVTVKDGVLDMSKLNMGLFGGNVSASGSYCIPEGESAPALDMKLNISNALFSKTFSELDLIRRMLPLFEKTGGNYSMTLDMSTRLTDDMSAELNTIKAVGEIRSSGIHIQNIKALDAMALALKDDKLKHIEAKDVKINFSIENGKIATKPFDLKMGNVEINLSGTTSLDQSIDYKAIVSLPDAALGGYLKRVNVLIGGTFSSPKISIDVKNTAKDAITQVLNKELAEKLGSKDLSKEIEKQADRLRAQAKETGEKLVKLAQEQGDKLTDQASNPITKIAAKKSAEVMVKKAQEQAQNLINQAEKQIEKLQQP